jgi:hypothetical protein
VALVGTRLFVALDACAATAAAVANGVGRRRLRGFARVPLAPGVVVPSASGATVLRPEEAREAVRRAAAGAGMGSGRATLVLPDGLARLALLSPPRGADAREFARFRLAATLPWPATDAIVDLLPVARGRVIAAAVARATVVEHEQLLVSGGLALDRVHLAPLMAAQSLASSGPRDAVHVVLGDAAACLFVVLDGSIAAVRSRRRDGSPGEASRLAAEASRTARLAADGQADSLPVLLAGAQAARLRSELGLADARLTADGERWPDAAEVAWLSGALS